jgi:hypothetical protein
MKTSHILFIYNSLESSVTIRIKPTLLMVASETLCVPAPEACS